MDIRTLILLRHAKSDYPGGVIDHGRPLAPRGRREAALAGAEIGSRCPPLGAVLCSDAVRTQQTLARTGLAADEVPVTFSPELYEASPGDILRAIAAVDDAVGCLLVIGHAPGIPATTQQLTDPMRADDAGLALLETGFPTSAFAVLTTAVGWAELDENSCALVDFVIPR